MRGQLIKRLGPIEGAGDQHLAREVLADRVVLREAPDDSFPAVSCLAPHEGIAFVDAAAVPLVVVAKLRWPLGRELRCARVVGIFQESGNEIPGFFGQDEGAVRVVAGADRFGREVVDRTRKGFVGVCGLHRDHIHHSAYERRQAERLLILGASSRDSWTTILDENAPQ